MAKFIQGRWAPLNENKYKGDYSNIIYRSSWERTAFEWLDKSPDIVEWNSEEVIVPYRSPLDGRMHRYFVDLWLKKKDGAMFLAEIKPLAQTRPPKLPKSGRKTKSYINQVSAYLVNQAKWKSARQYSVKKGWTFIILTEKQLMR
ncbi:MAG: head completion protein [Candidatus Marinimicrobia bacterium]|jgi:hypothetical protein|nr:head completion protein [Candidatus Neomarinimicrobiota bacterium]